jgi:hypothetical protein
VLPSNQDFRLIEKEVSNILSQNDECLHDLKENNQKSFNLKVDNSDNIIASCQENPRLKHDQQCFEIQKYDEPYIGESSLKCTHLQHCEIQGLESQLSLRHNISNQKNNERYSVFDAEQIANPDFEDCEMSLTEFTHKPSENFEEINNEFSDLNVSNELRDFSRKYMCSNENINSKILESNISFENHPQNNSQENSPIQSKKYEPASTEVVPLREIQIEDQHQERIHEMNQINTFSSSQKTFQQFEQQKIPKNTGKFIGENNENQIPHQEIQKISEVNEIDNPVKIYQSVLNSIEVKMKENSMFSPNERKKDELSKYKKLLRLSKLKVATTKLEKNFNRRISEGCTKSKEKKNKDSGVNTTPHKPYNSNHGSAIQSTNCLNFSKQGRNEKDRLKKKSGTGIGFQDMGAKNIVEKSGKSSSRNINTRISTNATSNLNSCPNSTSKTPSHSCMSMEAESNYLNQLSKKYKLKDSQTQTIQNHKDVNLKTKTLRVKPNNTLPQSKGKSHEKSEKKAEAEDNEIEKDSYYDTFCRALIFEQGRRKENNKFFESFNPSHQNQQQINKSPAQNHKNPSKIAIQKSGEIFSPNFKSKNATARVEEALHHNLPKKNESETSSARRILNYEEKLKSYQKLLKSKLFKAGSSIEKPTQAVANNSFKKSAPLDKNGSTIAENNKKEYNEKMEEMKDRCKMQGNSNNNVSCNESMKGKDGNYMSIKQMTSQCSKMGANSYIPTLTKKLEKFKNTKSSYYWKIRDLNSKLEKCKKVKKRNEKKCSITSGSNCGCGIYEDSVRNGEQKADMHTQNTKPSRKPITANMGITNTRKHTTTRSRKLRTPLTQWTELGVGSSPSSMEGHGDVERNPESHCNEGNEYDREEHTFTLHVPHHIEKAKFHLKKPPQNYIIPNQTHNHSIKHPNNTHQSSASFIHKHKPPNTNTHTFNHAFANHRKSLSKSCSDPTSCESAQEQDSNTDSDDSIVFKRIRDRSLQRMRHKSNVNASLSSAASVNSVNMSGSHFKNKNSISPYKLHESGNRYIKYNNLCFEKKESDDKRMCVCLKGESILENDLECELNECREEEEGRRKQKKKRTRETEYNNQNKLSSFNYNNYY